MISTPTTSWTTEITAYLTYLHRDAGHARGTVSLRRHQLADLARYRRRTGEDGGPWTVSTEDLLEWMASHPWAPETRKSARITLRGFYSWAVATGRTDRSPAGGIPPVLVPRAAPRPIPDPLAAAALLAADPRVALLIALAGYCGLRAGELAKVHSQDLVGAGAGTGLLVHGKGGHTRVVPLVDEGLVAAVRAARGWVFPGQVEGHLSSNHVTRLLSRALPGAWTGHSLRHRAATTAYAATTDLRAVQDLLGHASSRTTERYVAVSGPALRAAAAGAHGWRT